MAYLTGRVPVRGEKVASGTDSIQVWVQISAANLSIEDRYTAMTNLLIRCMRTWRNTSDTTTELNLTYEIGSASLPDFWMTPAVSYNGNNVGTGKGLNGKAKCQTQAWLVV